MLNNNHKVKQYKSLTTIIKNSFPGNIFYHTTYYVQLVRGILQLNFLLFPRQMYSFNKPQHFA